MAQEANKSGIKWEGNSHQAGSDSLVTMKLFLSKSQEFFDFCKQTRKQVRQLNKNIIYNFDSTSDDDFIHSKTRQVKGGSLYSNYQRGQKSQKGHFFNAKGKKMRSQLNFSSGQRRRGNLTDVEYSQLLTMMTDLSIA